ncbi:MAG: hypothetical protein FIB03_03920, partial [Anaerolineae bacterium]|nr:hypothetical protein [Anaerolineae bacterium]
MSFEGEHSVRLWRVIYLNILLVISVALSSCSSIANAQSPEPTSTPEPEENGPTFIKITNNGIKEAIVRIIGTSYTDDLDQNKLSLSQCFKDQFISVWAPGNYIKTISCDGNSPVEYVVTLDPIDINSGAIYSWAPAASSCLQCHIQAPDHDEYNEWHNSGHANVFQDRYFESMYSGRNIRTGAIGKQSSWGLSSDGKVRLQPSDISAADYTGPGFRLDYHNEYGNCAICHVPTAV